MKRPKGFPISLSGEGGSVESVLALKISILLSSALFPHLHTCRSTLRFKVRELRKSCYRTKFIHARIRGGWESTIDRDSRRRSFSAFRIGSIVEARNFVSETRAPEISRKEEEEEDRNRMERNVFSSRWFMLFRWRWMGRVDVWRKCGMACSRGTRLVNFGRRQLTGIRPNRL